MILNIVLIVVFSIFVCVGFFCYLFSDAKGLQVILILFSVVGIIVNAVSIHLNATPPEVIYEECKENVEKAQQDLEDFLNEHPEFKESK